MSEFMSPEGELPDFVFNGSDQTGTYVLGDLSVDMAPQINGANTSGYEDEHNNLRYASNDDPGEDRPRPPKPPRVPFPPKSPSRPN